MTMSILENLKQNGFNIKYIADVEQNNVLNLVVQLKEKINNQHDYFVAINEPTIHFTEQNSKLLNGTPITLQKPMMGCYIAYEVVEVDVKYYKKYCNFVTFSAYHALLFKNKEQAEKMAAIVNNSSIYGVGAVEEAETVANNALINRNQVMKDEIMFVDAEKIVENYFLNNNVGYLVKSFLIGIEHQAGEMISLTNGLLVDNISQDMLNALFRLTTFNTYLPVISTIVLAEYIVAYGEQIKKAKTEDELPKRMFHFRI